MHYIGDIRRYQVTPGAVVAATTLQDGRLNPFFFRTYQVTPTGVTPVVAGVIPDSLKPFYFKTYQTTPVIGEAPQSGGGGFLRPAEYEYLKKHKIELIGHYDEQDIIDIVQILKMTGYFDD